MRNTSSDVVFRTFWAVRPAGERVEVHLLDNQLAPTGLAENLSHRELAGKGWMYVDKLQACYDGLKDKLKPVPAPEAAAPAEAKPTPAPAAPQATQAATPAAKDQPSPCPARPACPAPP